MRCPNDMRAATSLILMAQSVLPRFLVEVRLDAWPSASNTTGIERPLSRSNERVYFFRFCTSASIRSAALFWNSRFCEFN
jgi:hypothetical protein